MKAFFLFLSLMSFSILTVGCSTSDDPEEETAESESTSDQPDYNYDEPAITRAVMKKKSKATAEETTPAKPKVLRPFPLNQNYEPLREPGPKTATPNP